MLLMARYSEEPHTDTYNGHLVTLNYGEFVYGRKRWVQELEIPEQRMRTLMKRFIDEGMIELRYSYPKGSVYTIKNYEKFNHHSNHQKTLVQQEFEVDANHQNNQQLTTNQPPTNHKRIKKESNTEIKYIYDYWNTKKIIEHRRLTDSMTTKINSILKDYTLDEVLDAIENYKTVLESKEHFWSHKYTLDEFMRQKDFIRFLSTSDPLANFRTKASSTSISRTNTNYSDTAKKERTVERYVRPDSGKTNN
jgi:hypothetical protein